MGPPAPDHWRLRGEGRAALVVVALVPWNCVIGQLRTAQRIDKGSEHTAGLARVVAHDNRQLGTLIRPSGLRQHGQCRLPLRHRSKQYCDLLLFYNLRSVYEGTEASSNTRHLDVMSVCLDTGDSFDLDGMNRPYQCGMARTVGPDIHPSLHSLAFHLCMDLLSSCVIMLHFPFRRIEVWPSPSSPRVVDLDSYIIASALSKGRSDLWRNKFLSSEIIPKSRLHHHRRPHPATEASTTPRSTTTDSVLWQLLSCQLLPCSIVTTETGLTPTSHLRDGSHTRPLPLGHPQ